MFLDGRPITEIDWPWLERCRDRAVEESRTLDFKRELPDLSSDRDKREFLHDVCAFANTEGGLLLYGVGETDGRMDSLSGCDLRGDTVASLKDRLERLVRGGLDPSFGGMSVTEISKPLMENASSAIVVGVGVERSSYAPHRVIAHDSRRFMLRVMKSTVEMDTEQIREQFRRSFIAAEDARERLKQSKTRGAANPIPPLNPNLVRLWTAAVPFYRNVLAYPIRSQEVKTALETSAMTYDKYTHKPYLHFDYLGAFLRAYDHPFPMMRLNRDGTVERTDFVEIGGAPGDPKQLNRRDLRDQLVLMFDSVRDLRQNVGVAGPALVSVSLHPVAELLLYQYGGKSRNSPLPFSEHMLSGDFELTDEHAWSEIRKEIADIFWQAAGHRQCEGFDENGEPVEP